METFRVGTGFGIWPTYEATRSHSGKGLWRSKIPQVQCRGRNTPRPLRESRRVTLVGSRCLINTSVGFKSRRADRSETCRGSLGGTQAATLWKRVRFPSSTPLLITCLRGLMEGRWSSNPVSCRFESCRRCHHITWLFLRCRQGRRLSLIS